VIDAAAIARLAEQSRTMTGPVPVVTETVRLVPVTTANASHLLKADADWSAEDLRNYVMGEIERLHGPQIRDAVKEKAIFTSFMGRWGAQAVPIARFAFEVQRGLWSRAPISRNRFTKGSDPYFAQKIAERLDA
jgi:hypothetical protein